MFKIKYLLLLITIVLFTSGCTHKGNKYQPDMETINQLNDYELQQVATSANQNTMIENYDIIPLRALKMQSPYGMNYSDYVNESLKEQLKQNKLYNDKSSITIESKLLKNSVDIWDFSIGKYDIEVEFNIKRNKDLLYSKNVKVIHTFPSHFLGQVAIENGLKNYPIAIKKVISKFLSDSKVIQVLEKK